MKLELLRFKLPDSNGNISVKLKSCSPHDILFVHQPPGQVMLDNATHVRGGPSCTVMSQSYETSE